MLLLNSTERVGSISPHPDSSSSFSFLSVSHIPLSGLATWWSFFKGTVHFKMKMRSLSRCHVVPNPYDHKRRYFKKSSSSTFLYIHCDISYLESLNAAGFDTTVKWFIRLLQLSLSHLALLGKREEIYASSGQPEAQRRGERLHVH